MSCIWFSHQSSEYPVDMIREQYRWLLVDGFVIAFNEYRAAKYFPSDRICVEKSISRWYGLGALDQYISSKLRCNGTTTREWVRDSECMWWKGQNNDSTQTCEDISIYGVIVANITVLLTCCHGEIYCITYKLLYSYNKKWSVSHPFLVHLCIHSIEYNRHN